MEVRVSKAERPGFRLFQEMVLRRRVSDVAAEIGARRQRVQRMVDQDEPDLDFYSCIRTHLESLVRENCGKLALELACFLLEPLRRIPTKIPEIQAPTGLGTICEMENYFAASMHEFSDVVSVWAEALRDREITKDEAKTLITEIDESICALGSLKNGLKLLTN